MTTSSRTPATAAGAPAPCAKISWFVYSGGEKLRHTATMRGHWPGWDATCSCGWATRTGGATRGYVQSEVRLHKLLDH